MVAGKVDRFDVDKLVVKYLNEAMSKVDLQGASLRPEVVPVEVVQKTKQRVETSEESEETPVVKKKK
jgi:hypothetical protein